MSWTLRRINIRYFLVCENKTCNIIFIDYLMLFRTCFTGILKLFVLATWFWQIFKNASSKYEQLHEVSSSVGVASERSVPFLISPIYNRFFKKIIILTSSCRVSNFVLPFVIVLLLQYNEWWLSPFSLRSTSGSTTVPKC